MSTSSHLQTDVKGEPHRGQSPELEAGALYRVEGDTRGGSRTGKSEANKAADESLRSLSASSTSQLFAQLKATMIKESVMRAAIERFGGGEKGLRGVLKVIMVWLVDRNRYLAQLSQSSEIDADVPWDTVLAMAMPSGGEQSRNAGAVPDQGKAVENQFVSFESFEPEFSDPDEGSRLKSAMSDCSDGWLSLADLKFDGGSGDERGDYGEVAMLESQDGEFLGELEQESRRQASVDIAASPSCWIASSNSSEMLRRSLVKKLSPTLSSGCDGDTYEGTWSNESRPNKIQCCPLSPVTSSSASQVCDGQSIFGSPEANFLIPCLPLTPCSIDPLFMDMSSFTSFDMRSPISSLVEDLSGTNPALGIRLSSLGRMDVHQSSSQDCVDPDRENQGQVVEAEAAIIASIRLARKKRIQCNRKVASDRVSGAAGSGGKQSRTMYQASSSPTSFVGRRPAGSPRLPKDVSGGRAPGQGQGQGLQDRTGSKYLFEKRLRPSDVGNLSRIILPKRDAESHLPSLSHKEGILFDCEDYITGESMAFHYRFWPNNKSRMYVLEYTGDFIRRHQLRVDDLIAMYKNEEDGKFLVRALKARDGQEPRPQVRNGKEIAQAISSGSLVGLSSPSLERNLSEISLSSNIYSSDKLKAALEPSVMVSPAQEALLSSEKSGDLPDEPRKKCTNTSFTFATLEAFDAELFVSPM